MRRTNHKQKSRNNAKNIDVNNFLTDTTCLFLLEKAKHFIIEIGVFET